ncbi:hypothetical protein E5676_scaffold267G00090 [Cucumis melo var. makuwa]|uniref:Uncharacterized protein n=1 Tax=Cucumis melo var. makuwa TaxID=1194695 RepID=A0A5D3E4U0_CUCMM|nr:hypothetical protein E6C27_scaffold174G001630 [Cucumis melo var. makuwa]TYK30788.1 hypothetical protein E5676_scaffold267G00090 [Cucumis melo var. makuwa]
MQSNDCQSGIDIDMVRVVRRDRSHPDCFSVFFGYTTDQFVLGAKVRARASWRATRSDRGEP